MFNIKMAAAVSCAAAAALAAVPGVALSAAPGDAEVSAAVAVSDRCPWADPDPNQKFAVTFVSDAGEVLEDDRGANRFSLRDGGIVELSGVDAAGGVKMRVEPVEGYVMHYSTMKTGDGYAFCAQCEFTGRAEVKSIRMATRITDRTTAYLDGSVGVQDKVAGPAMSIRMATRVEKAQAEEPKVTPVVETPAQAQPAPSLIANGDTAASQAPQAPIAEPDPDSMPKPSPYVVPDEGTGIRTALL